MSENQSIQAVQKEEKPSAGERFTAMVMKQRNSNGQVHEFSTKEKQLINGYFIKIDQMLMAAEAERLRKNENNRDHKYDNNLPYAWNTVDLTQLAQDLAHYAHVGLDMMEDNVLFPIPYKNSKGNMYTITLMEGYNGIRYQAEKYALYPFRSVTVEVVFSTDKFKPLKKSEGRPVESYEFEITQPFNRGEPVGVFGYIEYSDNTRNELVVFSKADVLKRKPKYASPEFWGGTKKTWVDGKQTEVEMEGWVPEMYAKTMKREIYGSKHIIRDPNKVDESYRYIQQRERQYVDIAVEAEVAENGNGAPLALQEMTSANIEPPAQAAQTNTRDMDTRKSAAAQTAKPVDDLSELEDAEPNF